MQTQEKPSDSEESFDSLENTSQNEETVAAESEPLSSLEKLREAGKTLTAELKPLSPLVELSDSSESGESVADEIKSLSSLEEPSDQSESGESVAAEPEPLPLSEKSNDGGESVAAESKQLSSLETLDRMIKLPVVETAWHQGQDVYGKIKNFNALFNWAFSTTEGAIQRTTAIASPIVHKFDGPIQFVDRKLVKGIDKLEKSAPIIKETPQQIFEQTKTCVMKKVQPHYNMVCALKDISLQKVNAVLATKYGSKAVNYIDSTSALAEKVVDYCFPVGKNEIVAVDDTPISAEENPVLHTIQTVGRLSNKVTRRIYGAVICHVEVLCKQEIHEYVTSLVAIFRISLCLNLLRGKRQPAITASNEESPSLKNSS